MRRMLSFQLSRMVRCGGHGQLLLPFPVEDWYHILRWMATGPVPTPSGQTIPPLPPRRKLPGPGIRLPRKFFRPMGSIQIKCSASGSHGSRFPPGRSLWGILAAIQEHFCSKRRKSVFCGILVISWLTMLRVSTIIELINPVCLLLLYADKATGYNFVQVLFR